MTYNRFTRPHGWQHGGTPSQAWDKNKRKWVYRRDLTEWKPEPPKAADISVAETLADRGKTHGDYTDHAALTQRTKDLWRGTAKWAELDEHERETLDMIAHKVGRILSGNPHFNDHWLDIAGYATLSAQRNPVVK